MRAACGDVHPDKRYNYNETDAPSLKKHVIVYEPSVKSTFAVP